MELAAGFHDAIATAIAAFPGAAIGAEREWRRHPRGLRSCALVAAAACVFARIAITYGGTNPGAVLGAIATGIGFLGASVVLRQGSRVRGLSMAATFWAVAAIGTVTGVSEYAQAVAWSSSSLISRCARCLHGSSASPHPRMTVRAGLF
jgi:putative Mg2+ transporter-C (MgtC) family protein